MARPKKINYQLLDRITTPEPYQILDKMRLFHGELQEANIAIAWRKRLSTDKDGHLVLGKCMRASDLQRELADYDFVILLNREIWGDEVFTEDKKRALMDHELCHAARAFDAEGNEQRDERGRPVWRTRKHDIEEFQEIVKRHGCYKKDLERFADELLKKRAAPLFAPIAETMPTATLITPDGTRTDVTTALASAATMGGTHQKRKPRADKGTVN